MQSGGIPNLAIRRKKLNEAPRLVEEFGPQVVASRRIGARREWPSAAPSLMGGVCSFCEETEEPRRGSRLGDEYTRTSSNSPISDGAANQFRRKVFATSRLSGSGRRQAKEPKRSPKSAEDRELITRALKEGTLLGALSTSQLEEMVDFMEVVTLRPGEPCEVDSGPQRAAHGSGADGVLARMVDAGRTAG